jgi:hypothetical protein
MGANFWGNMFLIILNFWFLTNEIFLGEGDRENEATKEKVGFAKWMGFVFSEDGNVVGTQTCQNFTWTNIFIGLAYQGKDIVFRFIIEYSSLRDFGP